GVGVLLGAPGGTANSLGVPVRAGADPDVGPRRWDRERSDAAPGRQVPDRRSGGGDVAEAGTGPPASPPRGRGFPVMGGGPLRGGRGPTRPGSQALGTSRPFGPASD